MAKNGKEFQKVSARIWRSRRFCALDSDHRLGMLYFLTSDHTELHGAGIIPPKYAAADLGWTEDKFLSVRDELERVGLIVIDRDTDEFYVAGWYRLNPPANASAATGWRRKLELIESSNVRLRAMEELADSTVLAQASDAPKPVKSTRPAKTYSDSELDW